MSGEPGRTSVSRTVRDQRRNLPAPCHADRPLRVMSETDTPVAPKAAGRAGPAPAFGELLRLYRSRAGLTQEDLAARSGISVRTLCDAEQGRVRRPRTRSILAVSTALGLSDSERDELCRAARVALPVDPKGQIHVEVLGPLSVRRHGVPVDLGSAMERRLLGLLAVQPGQVVSPDEIITVLWGATPPKTCLNLTHFYVGRLRRLLHDTGDRRTGFQVLVRTGGGYRLDLDGRQLDVLRFDDLVGQARSAIDEGRPQVAEELSAAALDCWRGQMFGGTEPVLAHHPAVVAAAARRVDAALFHADVATAAGHHDMVAVRLRAVVCNEPLHEVLHVKLMLALAAGGQQAAALHVFDEIRHRLDDELGIEPGPELKAAQLRVLRQDVPILTSSAPGPAVDGVKPVPAVVRPAQLPLDVAAFTGRDAHLERLDALLVELTDGGDSRHTVVIAAIDGTAGVGKTALALHWAHRVRDRFPDGQLYVNLRGFAAGLPVRPIDALAGFLRALGLSEERIPVQADEAAALFRSQLAGRRVLVVLDNAVDAAQVRPLLPASAGCLTLVTSRDRLSGLVARDGAIRLTLDVLNVDEADALLTRILGRHRITHESDAATDLIRACAHLPLALRIAAANLLDHGELSVSEYVADLFAGNRLTALEVDGDPEAAVRTTFELSYTRLDAEAQRLFRRIGLVTGPDITVDAAAALAGAAAQQTRRLLDRLTAAHLLDQPTEGRYTCHDLLRLYATERAGDDRSTHRQAALQRLYDHYLHTVDAAATSLYPQMLRLPVPAPSAGSTDARFDGAGQALAWLDAERSNLVAAIVQSARHGPQAVAWLLADALRGYFYQGMYAVDWLAALQAAHAAAQKVGDAQAQAATELGFGTYHWCQSQLRQAIDRHTRMVDLARRSGWTDGEIAALGNLGALYQAVGQLEQAAGHITRARDLARRAGRLAARAIDLTNLGVIRCQLGELEQAADHLGEALALFRQIGARGGEATARTNLAVPWHQMGRLDDALDQLDRALALSGEVGDRTQEPDTLICLAAIHCDLGRHDHALELASTALALAEETGRRLDQAQALSTLATIQHRLGRHRKAVDGHRRAIRLARDTNHPQVETEALIGLADSLLSLGETGTALTRARHALTLARRVGYRVYEGNALTTLATVHHRLGEQRQAADHARQALALHRRTGHRLGEARTHVTLGRIQHATGRIDQALDHWHVAEDLFAAAGVPEADDVRRLLSRQVALSASPTLLSSGADASQDASQ